MASDARAEGGDEEGTLRRRVKAELRKRLRALRATVPAAAIAERSARIVRRLRAHPAMAAASRVALFWPILPYHEVDLRAFDVALRETGAAIFYPSIDAHSRRMTFRRVDDTATLVEAGLGFAEPPATSEEADDAGLDVIVVPALAVAPSGHRIGYGAGYYDRTLPRFAPPAITVAVAFDFQLIVEIPVTEGDYPVDWIVTDERTMAAERPSAAAVT